MYALVITQLPQDRCLSSNTETRHLSCGIRMSTYAEPDMDSVDWSNKTCQGVVVPWNTFASNQKDRLSEYFRENLPSLCPYLEDCKNKDTPWVNQSLPLKWWLRIHPAIGWNVCWCEPFGDHAPLEVASLMRDRLCLPLQYTKRGGVLKTH